MYYEDIVVKYPLGIKSKKSLECEYKNYCNIKKSVISSLVDYSLEIKSDYYIMDRLYTIEKVIPSYNKIQKTFKKMNQKEYSITNIKVQEFTNAFKILNSKCNLKIDQKVIFFLNNIQQIRRGFMHGDLTQYNIMKNKNNKVVMIDLDRVRIDGYEDIDRIHFIIQYYVNNKKDFFYYLQYILRNKKISYKSFVSLLLYFLFRVDGEYNEGVILPPLYYKKLCATIKLFLNHEYFKVKEF